MICDSHALVSRCFSCVGTYRGIQSACIYSLDQERVSYNMNSIPNNSKKQHILHNINDHGIRQLYYVGSSNKVRIFVHYSYIHADPWKFGWDYVYGIIHINHCSSRYYS